MAEYELRYGTGAFAARVVAEDEVDALNVAGEMGLPFAGDITVYPADEVPAGADGVDPEEPE